MVMLLQRTMKPSTYFGAHRNELCTGRLASIDTNVSKMSKNQKKTDLGTALFSAGIQHMLDSDFFSLCFDY